MDGVVVVWQLAFWPPDRQVVVAAATKRAWAPRLVARLSFLELAVISKDRDDLALDGDALDDGAVYPCTYPGCSRGRRHPFDSAAQLANHRFAAHRIRSTNEDSMRRQERRDRQRAKVSGAAPEYIDRPAIRSAVSQRFPVRLAPTVRAGPLDIGEREYVRRRLCAMVTSALVREIGREPAELCVAIAELAASGLEPVRPSIIDDRRKSDTELARLEALFTKSAIVAS